MLLQRRRDGESGREGVVRAGARSEKAEGRESDEHVPKSSCLGHERLLLGHQELRLLLLLLKLKHLLLAHPFLLLLLLLQLLRLKLLLHLPLLLLTHILRL